MMTTNHPDPTPPPSEPAPSLRPVEEIAANFRAAHDWISDICTGERSWRMRVPADSGDTDIVLSQAVTDGEALLARLRAAEETLAAVGALAEKWRAYQETGFYPEASAHANAIENCGDALADLLDDHAALAEGASR